VQTASTSSSTNNLNVKTEVKQTIEGFANFGGLSDPLYSYVAEGMAKIN
jgi:hypothetical protein